jgi:peroxidase
VNLVTHYLDASNIYGSSVFTSNTTRSFSRGQLRISNGVSSGRSYLPIQNGQFFAGEGRVNENMGLAGVHTLFLREHNAIAQHLSQINRHWDDERLFLETRRIIQAIYQHIVYQEYVPALIGRSFAQSIDIMARPAGQYFNGYDASINASISNEFAAAAFRFGKFFKV